MNRVEEITDSRHLNKNDLNLEVRKIKDMYISFDGAKMTSTIANLDIEEMSYCLACAIEKHVDYFIHNIFPTGDFQLTLTDKGSSKNFQIKNLRFNAKAQDSVLDEEENLKSPSTAANNKRNSQSDEDTEEDKQSNTTFSQGSSVQSREDIDDDGNKDVHEKRDSLGRWGGSSLHGNYRLRIGYNRKNDGIIKADDSEPLDKGVDHTKEKLTQIDYSFDKSFERINLDTSGSLNAAHVDDSLKTDKNYRLETLNIEKSSNKSQTEEIVRKYEAEVDCIKEEIEVGEEEVVHREPINEELEEFLKESLKESMLFNVQQEKTLEKEGILGGTLEGFKIPGNVGHQIVPSIEVSRVRGLIENNDGNESNNVDVMKRPVARGQNCAAGSLTQSFYTEVELNNENMDVAEQIKVVFERTYNEKNLTPEEYNRSKY